jgi:transposase
MKYYAGLDVAMKETFLCILDETGKRVFESKAPTEPQPIYDELVKSGVPLEKVGLETGSLSNYLTKGLQKLGLEAICIDARKMAAILSVTVNKNDKNDARGIADAMRCNHYKSVNIREDANASLKILIKSRTTLVQTRTTLKNTVRGLLKVYGIRLGDVSHQKFSEKVREHTTVSDHAKIGIKSLLKSYETTHEEIVRVEKTLHKIAKEDEEIRRLMTTPGVGAIVALSYRADMGDPARFEDSQNVGAYYGMTPRQYSSGETVRQGRISKCGAQDVRYLLTEAAIVLLTRSKAWSPLKAWGLKIQKKHGFKKAAVAVGRKLSVILHRMLVTGESFKFSKAELSSALQLESQKGGNTNNSKMS